jgi:electron transport complex protein RnfC
MIGSVAGTKRRTLTYSLLHQTPLGPQEIQTGESVTLLVDAAYDRKDAVTLKEGDTVKTGQKLVPVEGSDAYAISSVTGTVSRVALLSGDFGRNRTAITVRKTSEDDFEPVLADAEPTLDTLRTFLSGAPGNPPLALFGDSDKPIHTIVVCGLDADLLVATNQYIIKARGEAVEKGIEVLKKATGIENVVIAVPRDLVQGFGHTGAAGLIAVDNDYPAALPRMILYRAFGKEVPAEQTCQDLGYAFVSAEAVASIGSAFAEGRPPLHKTVTLVDKVGRMQIVTARIGTPIGKVLEAGRIELKDRDRIVVGGPMTGSAVFSEAHPVTAETDAVLVQESGSFTLVSDYPCINCGECVRVCPARVPVSMLVRFLEADQYENAADEYDLHCCVDCGLCSYVCVARIPIFQYIRLAKHELARLNAVEASNG